MSSLEVVAGALFDEDGRVLIAQRPPGKALAGRWELPGGKLHAGEEAFAGLVRELREELGVVSLFPGVDTYAPFAGALRVLGKPVSRHATPRDLQTLKAAAFKDAKAGLVQGRIGGLELAFMTQVNALDLLVIDFK